MVCLACLAATQTPMGMPIVGALAVAAPIFDPKRRRSGMGIVAGLSAHRRDEMRAAVRSTVGAVARVTGVGSTADLVNAINKYVADHSTRHDLSTASWREAWIKDFGNIDAQINQGGISGLLKRADACIGATSLYAAGETSEKCITGCDDCDQTASVILKHLNRDLGLAADNGWASFTQMLQFLGRYPDNADDPPGERAAPVAPPDPDVVNDDDRRYAAMTDETIDASCSAMPSVMASCRDGLRKLRDDAKAKIARIGTGLLFPVEPGAPGGFTLSKDYAKLPAPPTPIPPEEVGVDPLTLEWRYRRPPAWISEAKSYARDYTAGMARVGAASSVIKRYVDVRGAPWEITIGDTITAESSAYRTSKREASSIDKMIESIDAFVRDAKRVSHASTDDGASSEGKYTDADGSEWVLFYYKQQDSAEPDGQTGYYAERYGALVGPSYVGTNDLKTIISRYLSRVEETKGSTSATFSKGDAAPKLDDMPAKPATAPVEAMSPAVAIRWVALPAIVGGSIGGLAFGLPGLIIGGVSAGLSGHIVHDAKVHAESVTGCSVAGCAVCKRKRRRAAPAPLPEVIDPNADPNAAH